MALTFRSARKSVRDRMYIVGDMKVVELETLLREPEATLEPRVHECVRHTSELYRCHVTYIGVTLSPLG